ncbi:TPA: hypothetical protein HNV42_20690 [Escherichia coli]|nr:hypothetical protein [Escherichia coli]
MINRIVSFFILCLVLCIPLCVAYFHSGELMMRFVFFWPFFMSILWIVGGVYFWAYRERHWPWGENAPAPQLKDNPSNRAEMSPEAAGIAACLMTYSHHACRTECYAMTVHYYRLRDYALQHPECNAIMCIID